MENSRYSKIELSRLSGLSYATLYSELQKLEGHKLVQNVDGKYSSSLAPQLKAALSIVLGLNGTSTPSAEPTNTLVKHSLQALGAPVVVEDSTDLPRLLGLSETLVRSALLAKDDPSAARALPVVLAAKADELNIEELLVFARKLHAKQELGMFLDLSSTLSGSLKLKRLARKFQDGRVKETRSFFNDDSKSPLFLKLSERNTPEVAKRWKFRMNMSYETFESTFKKFGQAK